MFALRQASRVIKISNPCRAISSWQIAYKDHGEPLDVLFERKMDLQTPGKNEVLVNFRASPINPSDINAIQGTYPLKPKLPGVAGNEGAGYVKIAVWIICCFGR